MGSRTEVLRNHIIDSGDPLRHHSLNQKKIKWTIEGGERRDRKSKKVARSEKRRGIEQYERYEFPTEDGRVVEMVFKKNTTD